jgi:hypothetical protein
MIGWLLPPADASGQNILRQSASRSTPPVGMLIRYSPIHLFRCKETLVNELAGGGFIAHQRNAVLIGGMASSTARRLRVMETVCRSSRNCAGVTMTATCSCGPSTCSSSTARTCGASR